jgi:hypothetical protein
MNVHIYRTTDDYGRSVLVAEQNLRRIAVMVKVPRAQRWFVNHLASDVERDVTDFTTRKAALAHFTACWHASAA